MIVGIFSPLEVDLTSKIREKGIDIKVILRSDNNVEEIALLNPDIIICRNRDNIARFVKDCPNLKFVFIVEVGIEKLPFQELIRHNIRVANTSGISADIMSNYTMACILNHATKLEDDIFNMQQHHWIKFQTTDSLQEKTLLVVGAGRTGVEIAKKAKAFAMNTIGIVNHKRNIENFDRIGTIEELDKYLQIADYIVCTIPLTPKTMNLFDKSRFNHMKSSAVFINISRGAIVNEKDLLEAAEQQLFSKAYLDVFSIEPLPENHAFWNQPNIIVTPHQSGRLEDHLAKALTYFITNYVAYKEGLKMPNEVNLEQGY